MKSQTKLVTPESLVELLNRGGDFQIRTVGRALVALFNRQTDDEKASDATRVDNGRGFKSCDAYSGSLTAKYFMKHGTLLPWQVEKWTKPVGKSGRPRIAQYHRQLNEIALLKRLSA